MRERPLRVTEIVILADGFDVIDGRSGASLESRVRWANIREIIAFKLDFGTYDTIRLGIRTTADDCYVELDEEWIGFTQIVGEIERRFALTHEWWSRVAFPAFKTNPTTLWSKSTGSRT
jgi:hypothetical protein